MIFKIYEDTSFRWRWALLNSDRTIIALSAESYPGRRECIDAIDSLKRKILVAAVIEEGYLEHSLPL